MIAILVRRVAFIPTIARFALLLLTLLLPFATLLPAAFAALLLFSTLLVALLRLVLIALFALCYPVLRRLRTVRIGRHDPQRLRLAGGGVHRGCAIIARRDPIAQHVAGLHLIITRRET